MNKKQSFLQIQKKRAFILDKVREFFKTRGFLEVQTPIFVKLPYEFSDERNEKHKGYVITSPEYSLKKLLSQGFPKLFEITKVFRQNESFGGLHNPEFTMMEWYRPRSNYRKIMKDTEELVLFLARSLYKEDSIKYHDQKIDLSLPWQKISVKNAFKKFADIDLDKAKTLTDFHRQFKEKLPENYNWDDIFYYIFLNRVEPNLPKNKPVIIYDYPLPQAALAKRKSSDNFYAERFEVFIAGMELANCFSELTDWREQEKRLKHEKQMRKELGKEIYEIDQDFINAIKQGMPDTGGIAMGIDRLQMLLLDIQNINDLLILPTKELFSNH